MFLFGAVLLLLAVIESGSNFLNIDGIRLVNGNGPFGGRVEVSVNGIWGTVCDDSFDMDDAAVMCRMMNLKASAYVTGAWYGPGTGPVFAQEFECTGYETHLRDCPFVSNVQCTNERDVGIICSECDEIDIHNGHAASISANGTELAVKCNNDFTSDVNTSTCEGGVWSNPSITCVYDTSVTDIKLTNGIGLYDGRIEVLINGTWGTVCGTSFSSGEARAICNILFGTTWYRTYNWARNSYGEKSGPIYIDNLDCDGTETDINECFYSLDVSCTDHYYDAVVSCNVVPLNITDIRLVNGTGPYDGIVEVQADGHWGSICNRRVEMYDAQTICRTMNASLAMYFDTAVYGESVGPVLIDHLSCSSDRSHIDECSYYSPYRTDCSHYYDLSIACTPCGIPDIYNGEPLSFNDTELTVICHAGFFPDYIKMKCISNGSWVEDERCTSQNDYPLNISDIRLISNYVPTEGRVQVLVDGTWGTICDTNFDSKDAAVICEMFGWQYSSHYVQANGFGRGTGPIYIDELDCNGTESHINECSYEIANHCTHYDDVGVICTGYQLNITDIRLAGTNGPYHGRIELEVNGTWGTVCDGYLSSNDARVFCRMFGLTYHSYYHNAYYGEGSGPIYIDTLLCYGWYSHINECKHSVNNYYNCDHGDDASVMCYGPQLNITDARLVDGTSVNDGRAEIKVGDIWGTICDENFNILAADLFCDMLGLRAARFFTGALYGEGSGPVFIDQLFCEDDDLELSSCNYLFLNECSHDRDVSVVCNECGQPDIYYWDAGYFTYNGSSLYADCSFYKSYVGTLKLTCDNETRTWITEGECQEYSYPLNVTGLRLAGGPGITAGRVEVESLDTWGTVCSHSFGQAEANMICSMIGYPPAVRYFTGTDYGTGTGPIFVDDLDCDEGASDLNDCAYKTHDNCNHDDDISVVCTDCGDPTPSYGSINSTLTNVGAAVEVTCEQDHKLIGESVIICQINGTWSDNPECILIDCGDPTPEHGFSNATSTVNGTTVYIECDKGYDLVGDDFVVCQENETWTDDTVCQIKDCGNLSIPYADVTLPNDITTYGETVLVNCWTGYVLTGNPTVTCLSNGSWEMLPFCTIVDCGDPTPVKGFTDKNETTYGTVVEITCIEGNNISGNSTIICTEDGIWSSTPVCDPTDCGLLSVPNGNVNDSLGTTVGSVATIECEKGFDRNGSSFASCIDTGVSARWNYSISCELQFCFDPTPQNGRISNTDATIGFVFENYAEIECDTGYAISGDNIITCADGGVWSDNTTCEILDCGPLAVPVYGSMDASMGTKYDAQITFSCSEGYLLVGEHKTVCGENAEWSNEAPTCAAKSDVGDNCINDDYCLFEDSRCVESVCTCITGIYDNRTKKCDAMPLMPYGTGVGDVSVQKHTICSPKLSFGLGFPIGDKMHTDLYVCTFGYVSFDNPFSNPTPPRNRGNLQSRLLQRVLLAPFYGPIDRRKSGDVFYRTYDIVNYYETMKEDAEVISYIENIVKEFGNLETFDTSFLLIATWLDVKPIGGGFDSSKTSTFQVVLVSDGKLTYAFYIYGNGMMQWVNNLSTSPQVWVGHTVNSVTYTHPFSFSNAALQIDSKITIAASKRDVAGLVFRPMNTNGITQSNAAVDCIKWYNQNYEDKKRIAYIASLTPECPCDIRLSRFDPWFWRIGLYRWRYDLKYKCVDMLHVGIFGHYGKTCCYDLNTWLWVYERPLAGSFQLYNARHPLEHKLNDEQPRENCCEQSDYCNLYYELRPTGSCYKASPYNFGTFWGDPHFSTLDGMNFTFNGLGEYTLLQINTDNCSFDLQARTERALKEDGNLSFATVFTAFAAKYSINSSVHVERNNDRTGFNLYGNDQDLTDQFYFLTEETDLFVNDLTITKQNGSVNVYFPLCDISLTISISVEMLTLSTFVPGHLTNQTSGLLGNYNGDASDDFTMPNGTVHKANLTDREIFAYGQTWAINSNNSAFFYDVGKSHIDFHNESYVPKFFDEADPLLIAKGEEICNGSKNIECVFDYVSTEKTEIAEQTKTIKVQSDVDKIEIDETVPTFEGCSTVNVTKGQNASCTLNVEDGDTIQIVSSNVSVDVDQEFSTITFVPTTDEPISIRVAVSNENGRLSPSFVVTMLMCTACNDHGVCTEVPRTDQRENEYFHYLTCECDAEFEGIDCEKDFDGCAANPCSFERNCTTLTAEEQKTQNRSYICDPCPDGFQEDSIGDCIDIDECASSNGYCDQNCTNTDGTFECICNDGYRVDSGDSSVCKDINECEEALHDCEHICNNTDGGFTCQCYAGYELNTTSGTCVQISGGSCTDMQQSECSNAHGCTTVDNNPVCFCKDGYELDATGIYCQDVDECSRGVCQQDCVNTNGSFECICFNGYRLEGLTSCTECDVLHWGANCEQDCVCIGRGADICDPVKGCVCESGWYGATCNDDINECESEVDVCEDPRKTCVNKLGSYGCECRTGFYETDQGFCEDMDECSDPEMNNCTQECINAIGSYTCGCLNGYTKYDHWSCEDINECELRTHSCEQRCMNNEGHYSCFCHYGYSLNDDRRTCTKLSDPCLSINNLTCSHFCELVDVNAVCGCKSGFLIESDNETCTDINECADDDENKCDGDATCINTEGSFLCECPDGKQLENDGRTCTECDDYHYGRNCLYNCSCLNGVCDKKTGCICDPGWGGTFCDIDIDECATEQVVCSNENSVCINRLGSALCSCDTGYSNNSGICQDIDECDDVTTHECSQICTNTEGSYTCSCQHGFVLDGNCEDIDECAGIHDCDQTCENTVGSYRCSCEEGFRLNLTNRMSCIAEHECNEDQNSTCPQQSSCFVNNGVVHCTCLKGYQGDACIDIDECMANSNPCSQNCSNTEGSFSCNCNIGFSLLEDAVSCKECDMWKYGDSCGTLCSCYQHNTETCDSITGNCTCKLGWSGSTCDVDINECNSDGVCSNNSVCNNTNGSYNCKCLTGYFKTGSRECEVCDFRHFGDNCLSDCTCSFENTEYCDHKTGDCTCNKGWSGDECTDDINECINNQNICDTKPNSTCSNINGSFTCDCNTGFVDRNNMCEDINECLYENVNNCHQMCKNTPGSFFCSCSTGYSMQNETCIDIDECDENIDGCEHNCSNSIGSYTCLCDTGFQLSTDETSCEPCDMWTFGLSCVSNCSCQHENTEICDAKTGLCTCKTGWDGTKCESDINECDNETACSVNSMCENLNGSFICVCNDGFNKTDLGECIDVDECSTNMNRCSQNCTNTEGSYTCSCLSGFFLQDDNTTCHVCQPWTFGVNCESNCTCEVSNSVSCDAETGQCECKTGWSGPSCAADVDECMNISSCPSNSSCTNFNGTYECRCYNGYYKTEDHQCNVCQDYSFGKNCIEICTCQTENTEFCHHVNGTCFCKLGWEGENCSSDIDECEHDEFCEDKPESTCNNTLGSFTCFCNDGYREQNNTCEDIDECLENAGACSQNCTNTDGSFACSSAVGYYLEDDNVTCAECVKWTFGENCMSNCSCNKSNTDTCDTMAGQCACFKGWNGTSCEDDINECDNETSCPHNSLCHNYDGSYECVCNRGYRGTNTGNCEVCPKGNFGNNCSENCECIQQNTESCNHVAGNCTCNTGWTGAICSEDIDECEENVTLCQSKVNSTCENTNGSYNCRCNEGLREQGNMCTDCDEWTYGQDCQMNCTCNISNTDYCDPVTGLCICLSEWKGTGCEVDVDECDAEDSCPMHSSCVNSFGSFDCICNKGYIKVESKTCEECDDRHFGENCSKQCTCEFENTETCHHVSGNCSCIQGWTGETCSDDVNECQTNSTICDVKKNSTCNNTIGSFKCSCDGGFQELQNDTCLECQDGSYGKNCSEICTCHADNTESCHHVNGICFCKLGWENENCSSDIDECEHDEICEDKPDSTCNNTMGSFKCVCNDGYRDKNNKCEDIDECLENSDVCSQNCTNTDGSFYCVCAVGYWLDADNVTCQECVKWTFGDNCQSECSCNKTNTGTCDSGTGQCACLKGWSGANCDSDINECENDTACPLMSTCLNSEGSYECICNTGYRFISTGNCEVCPDGTFGNNCSRECECSQQNTESCDHVAGNCTCKKGWTGDICSEDIDECKENVTLCMSKANATCENTNGSYSCRCNEGLREQGNICTECDIWKYGQDCQLNCTCNISKSEYCDPVSGVCTCLPEWNGTNCEDDVDECKDENICPIHSSCENSIGTFNCRCDKGYLWTDTKTCEECDERNFGENCSEECTCEFENTESCHHISGNCSCIPGWTGETCSDDVNECQENNTICDTKQHSTCNNTIGSFECSCDDGFQDLLNGTCSDVDECKADSNDCVQSCENTVGGYLCKCLPGYNGSGNNCTDIDECIESPCDQNCTNTDGHFVCYCRDGFQLQPDNATCKVCDRTHFGNKCLQECSCNFTNTLSCDSVTGHCSCAEGWMGADCSLDIDECTVGADSCRHKLNSRCVNTDGLFVCPCNEGYLEINNTCIDINECDQSEHGCLQECVNTGGSYYCSCRIGYRATGNDCTECTNNTHGVNCSEQCQCNAKNSANEVQTCDTVTGDCVCKSNWNGSTCDEDINECDVDDTLCSEDKNTTCVNTDGWYKCDCIKGFVNPSGEECVAAMSTTTVRPESPILIIAVIKIEIDIPPETNLNAASVYISFETKLLATLHAYFRKFTLAVLEIIITDIRPGSIIANYSVRYGTADNDVASKLVGAIMELDKGTEIVYDGQTVNASSDSYKGIDTCEILYAMVGNCGEGYTCNVQNDIPVCSKEQSKVNVSLAIGLSAAGLFVLILSALLVVFVRRIRRGRKNETYSAPRDHPEPIRARDDDEASDFYKNYKWQDGKVVDAGFRLPSTKFILPRFKTPADLGGFNQPYNVMPAKPPASHRDARQNWY